jgi:hypothetical protein
MPVAESVFVFPNPGYDSIKSRINNTLHSAPTLTTYDLYSPRDQDICARRLRTPKHDSGANFPLSARQWRSRQADQTRWIFAAAFSHPAPACLHGTRAVSIALPAETCMPTTESYQSRISELWTVWPSVHGRRNARSFHAMPSGVITQGTWLQNCWAEHIRSPIRRTDNFSCPPYGRICHKEDYVHPCSSHAAIVSSILLPSSPHGRPTARAV